MNNLSTRTLFISLLLSVVTLSAVKKEKIKSNRWKLAAKGVKILGGVVGGGLVGNALGRYTGKVIAYNMSDELTVGITNLTAARDSNSAVTLKESRLIML